MHTYGNWPDERFNEVDDAAAYIGQNIAKWGRISVSQYKEKFGEVRVYCHFGFDSFYSIWRPRHHWIPKWWLVRLDFKVSQYILPLLNHAVIPVQKLIYKYFYRRAIQRWPYLYNEILASADWGELFEGYIPGYKHNDFFEMPDENLHKE